MAPVVANVKLNANGIPEFEELPLNKSDPVHSAWGLYGPTDELGTLNRLTDERVAAAARDEVRSGARVSLNWPLGAQATGALFSRQLFHQELISKMPRCINDDVWTFNSQISSQWDGLRHYAYQKEEKFYNGVTMQEIHGVGPDGKRSTVNGIHAWAEKGIVGRGVLVDFHSWRLKQTDARFKTFDAFTTWSIKLDDIKACLADQGTELRFGDILLIRTGWMLGHESKTEAELHTVHSSAAHQNFCGVEQSEEVLKWIWDNFAAVGGDQPGFEAWPSHREWAMHEIILSGFGCPIGELFHLEALAEQCKREGRYSFFVTSEPCNVIGGVASPPNILAIF